MNSQKSKAEILQETIDWYAADPDERRAVSMSGECMYSTAEGTACCAVGRVLEDPWRAECEYGGDPANSIPENWFRPEYRGHVALFWERLQGLHDHGCNWTAWGISEDGVECIMEIAEEFQIPKSSIQVPGTGKTLLEYTLNHGNA